MLVTTKIGIELQRPSYPAVINAVQGDQNTRRLEISLYSGSVAWQVPENATVAMRYCKPDKTKGYYDTMPDGSSAFTVSGNTVSILLAPQILTVPGSVSAQVVLLQGAEVLSTFGIQIHVEADPSAGVMESEDYINWLQWIESELDAYLEQLKVNGEFVGGTFVSNVNMNGNVIYGLPDPVADGQPVTKRYGDATYLKNTGGEMTGPINMNSQSISGLPAPTANDQAANMGYVNQQAMKAAARNLLDNSDFTNPVNQREQKSYAGAGYGFDRWLSQDSENVISFNDDGYISFTHQCLQIVPAEKFRAGKKYTAVVCMHNGSIHMGSGTYGENFGELGHVWVEYTEDTGHCNFYLQEPGDVDWAALYEGEYITGSLPEYQPKGYGVELMECKRYFCKIDASVPVGIGVVSMGTVVIELPIGVTMRGARGSEVRISGGVDDAILRVNGNVISSNSVNIVARPRGSWLHMVITADGLESYYGHVALFQTGNSAMLLSAEL